MENQYLRCSLEGCSRSTGLLCCECQSTVAYQVVGEGTGCNCRGTTARQDGGQRRNMPSHFRWTSGPKRLRKMCGAKKCKHHHRHESDLEGVASATAHDGSHISSQLKRRGCFDVHRHDLHKAESKWKYSEPALIWLRWLWPLRASNQSRYAQCCAKVSDSLADNS